MIKFIGLASFFSDISIGQETLLCICFLFFFLLSGLSYRVIWKWRCDVYSLFANTQSFATPESDLTIWKNESKFECLHGLLPIFGV